QRERDSIFWSGDVWKLIVLLKKYRPDLSLHVVAAPPTGVCLVRKLDPASRFLAENYERLSAEFMALDYSYLEKDRAAKLNLFPNDWSKIQPLLGSARQLRGPHEEFVHGAGALPPFADRPHHQRLPATHIPGSKDLRHRRRVGLRALGVRTRVTPCILVHAELVQERLQRRNE